MTSQHFVGYLYISPVTNQGETPGKVRYNDAECFGLVARFNGYGVTHVACLISNPGLLPYGLCQPDPKVLLGVRNHHDAFVPRVCKDMMRTIDTGKSPTRFLEFTYQVRTAHLCV